MDAPRKLFLIKLLHSLIWLFFVALIGYIVYSGIMNRVTKYTWLGIALIFGEGIVLLFFRMLCPLTLLARRFSNSEKANFDIFLPNWLAKSNKLIFTSIFLFGLILVVFRAFRNS